MPSRRDFMRTSASLAGSVALMGIPLSCGTGKKSTQKSTVISVSAEDMLNGPHYNQDAVHRAFTEGLKELTKENTPENAWSSLFSPDDVVGIKINCIGAPKVSSSLESIHETIAGLKSAGVRDHNIVVWDRMDRELPRTGLKLNKSGQGVQVHGTSTEWEGVLPWIDGYDKDVYFSWDVGTLKKFRELVDEKWMRSGTHREIFNSVAWLWTLVQQGNLKAQKYSKEIRRLYMDYEDREGIQKLAEQVADEFSDVDIENEERSCFSKIVTSDITKLINIAVLKHNEDSGITWATKNIGLGVTTNKIRFHIDYCAKAIPEILSFPCLKNKMVLHIGEAAKISVKSVAGTQMAYDNRIFFSQDPVAMDRLGLDILEEKRREAGLESIRDISTHVAACARKGLGTDDLNQIDLSALVV